MSLEMIRALEEIEKEKRIDREIIFASIEEALESSYRKNNDTISNTKVKVDREDGEIRVFATMEIVEEVEDPSTQITLDAARKINASLDIGDMTEIEITPRNFGRAAAQKAKQIIVQKIREEERNLIYNEYYSYEKDIINGTIQRIEPSLYNSGEHTIYIDIGKIEAILTPQEQVPGEVYRVGDRIKTYVLEVKRTNKDPKIFVSRTHPGLIKRLFELEVAEIRQGFVEIKSISREAGFRTKIAVYSVDEKVDPVGACVGQKGQRVQNIVNELRDEKIDIIEWSMNSDEFIANSLSPSNVLRVEVNEEEKSAKVVVPDNQLSLAIGKEGQNVRLAARLTGWKIDIKSESQIRSMLEADLLNLDYDSSLDFSNYSQDEQISSSAKEIEAQLFGDFVPTQTEEEERQAESGADAGDTLETEVDAGDTAETGAEEDNTTEPEPEPLDGGEESEE